METHRKAERGERMSGHYICQGAFLCEWEGSREAQVPPLETDARCGQPRGPPRGAVLIYYVPSDLTKSYLSPIARYFGKMILKTV